MFIWESECTIQKKSSKLATVFIWKRHLFSAKQTDFWITCLLPWTPSAMWSMSISLILEDVLENSCSKSYQVKLAVKIFEKYLWKSLFLPELQAFSPHLCCKWTYSEVFWKGFDFKFQNIETVAERCSIYKTGLLKYFAKFTGEGLYQSLLFNIVAGLKVATSLKRDLEIGVFLRILGNFKEHKQLRWLHLKTLICKNTGFCSCFSMLYERLKQIFWEGFSLNVIIFN